MPEENSRLVVQVYGVFNDRAGDPLEYWHEDAEYHVAREDPDTTIHRGVDALRRHFANWTDAYPDLKIEPLEVRENGDKVFAWVHFVGSGAASGVPVDGMLAHVVTVRGGKIARLAEFTDRAEGLEAAGLSE